MVNVCVSLTGLHERGDQLKVCIEQIHQLDEENALDPSSIDITKVNPTDININKDEICL